MFTLINIQERTSTIDPNIDTLKLEVEDGLGNTSVMYYNYSNVLPLEEQIKTWFETHDIETQPIPLPDTTVEVSIEKTKSKAEIVRICDDVTRNTINYYPEAEVESWTIQKTEAERWLSTPADHRNIDQAPFITQVCASQYGNADVGTRTTQVNEKAFVIISNALRWAGISAYVNGLRARAYDSIEGASTVDEVIQHLENYTAEANHFKATYGL